MAQNCFESSVGFVGIRFSKTICGFSGDLFHIHCSFFPESLLMYVAITLIF